MQIPENGRPIAVFDSGVGGVSVLRELYRQMPEERYLFYGDSANAPYGARTTEEVFALTLRCFEYFLARGAKAVVLACNTATSAAAARLRARWGGLPIIGLEPAVKPAVLREYATYAPGRKRVLVMATPLTLRERKFLELASHYESQAELLPLPAPRLVSLVEQGKMGSEEMRSYLSELLAPFREERVDAVVLGCTHFPFARADIAAALGYAVRFFDGAEGAARELRRQLTVRGLLTKESGAGGVIFENSDPSGVHAALSERLFRMP